MMRATRAAEASTANCAQLEISPNPAYIDEKLTLKIRGLAPGTRATIRTRVKDDAGRVWESRGVYCADQAGCVNPAEQESLNGTYQGRDVMGLFWSMKLAMNAGAARATFLKEEIDPDALSLTVEAGGHEIASGHLERRWVAPGTKIREVVEEGLVARLFLPPGHGTKRAVIVLGGSGGGYDLDKAALLARHGFATLALAYFGIPLLPQWLHRVPLEYFGRALAWLSRQPGVEARHVGVLGVSRKLRCSWAQRSQRLAPSWRMHPAPLPGDQEEGIKRREKSFPAGPGMANPCLSHRCRCEASSRARLCRWACCAGR
jgi:acyl-CoA thioester hydrolase/bile acid acetyltransferase-like protein